MGLHQILKVLCIKGHNQHNGKAAYEMGENIYFFNENTFHDTHHEEVKLCFHGINNVLHEMMEDKSN